PRLRIERGHADGALGVQLLSRRLLGARLDPAKQNSGDDPSPFDVREPPDWRAGRDGAAQLDDPTCPGNGGSGSAPLPVVFEHGRRPLSDRARRPLHDAHPGRVMGGVAVGGAELDGAADADVAGPPPSNGGGCTTGCHSFRSGVMMAERMFLSGQFSPEPSFFGAPSSMPILPMKVRPWSSL